MVYAIQVEQNERVSLAVISAGAEPSVLVDARRTFDQALAAEPQGLGLDSEQAQLRKALGVG